MIPRRDVELLNTGGGGEFDKERSGPVLAKRHI